MNLPAQYEPVVRDRLVVAVFVGVAIVPAILTWLALLPPFPLPRWMLDYIEVLFRVLITQPLEAVRDPVMGLVGLEHLLHVALLGEVINIGFLLGIYGTIAVIGANLAALARAVHDASDLG